MEEVEYAMPHNFPDEVFVDPLGFDPEGNWMACNAVAAAHCEPGETRVLGVYKLVRKVRVSTSVSITPEE